MSPWYIFLFVKVCAQNSRDIHLKQYVSDFIKSLKSNKDLNKKFELSFYTFGNEFKINDSLTFNEKNTNISEALTLTNQLFKDEVAPTILITDGNQTLGNDYEFSSINFKNILYPVVIGDSAKYLDLKIEQLNTNRYAFLKNKTITKWQRKK